VAGWGLVDVDDYERAKILQTVRLPVVTIDECKAMKHLADFPFDQGQICVGGVKGKGETTEELNDCCVNKRLMMFNIFVSLNIFYCYAVV
jgi:hypothetical protein